MKGLFIGCLLGFAGLEWLLAALLYDELWLAGILALAVVLSLLVCILKKLVDVDRRLAQRERADAMVQEQEAARKEEERKKEEQLQQERLEQEMLEQVVAAELGITRAD